MDRIVLIISGLFLPTICYFFESFIHRPEFIEEVAKLLLLLSLIKIKNFEEHKFENILVLGVSFATGEMIYYATNLYLNGNLNLIATRFFTTSFLHITTYLILTTGLLSKNKAITLAGLALAMTCHYCFNFFLIH